MLILFGYPTLLVDSQSKNIEQNLHYFITYAGAISTVNLERKELFKDLANKKRYAERGEKVVTQDRVQIFSDSDIKNNIDRFS